ncbi:MAG: Aspartate aminotransferase [Methanosaeta sp. PtaB.Bin039]|nr:MAG: Aspartate aminotransferase [Methanosaeta sp. PtaB.Bin039]HOT06010.1 DegT/DnrJ/EryC1/StrS family aminotransferase [Methanotrichaceae archaeon]HQF16786.1 DegT/DnrJ/EryC1/StrS family aminotransferase [Methanotrichaceae archaeon]HQI90112.1 DegT/DnrJ/EryC1/StrS family aminotransferase [Methanotrichaceae archaeon]HQJ27865.1 DegT/DnrJ/EryC1/StrS family aminotransferase [Methanotrichaceae archaeon]
MDFIPIAKPLVGDEEIAAVGEVMRSGMLVQGEAVRRFEEAFSSYLGVGASVAVSNGTVALDLALKALGIGVGDEVICPAFTFIATANAVLYQGARPVFADVDSRTFNLDPEDLAEKVTSRTRAVLGVHLYGQPMDMKAVQEICMDRDLMLVEDCAQAHGAEYRGKKVGSFSTGCFSFYPTKNMTTGEGGLITTSDESLASRARLLRNHGDLGKYNHQMVGYNYRMTNIQGAIGLVQMKRLEQFIEARIRNAEFLSSHIMRDGLTTPYRMPAARHVYNQYVLRVEEGFPLSRDALAERLQGMGIGTGIHYPKAVYQQAIYREMGLTGSCPVAEDVSLRVLSLPVHPALLPEQLAYIADTVNSLEA